MENSDNKGSGSKRQQSMFSKSNIWIPTDHGDGYEKSDSESKWPNLLQNF